MTGFQQDLPQPIISYFHRTFGIVAYWPKKTASSSHIHSLKTFSLEIAKYSSFEEG